MATNKKSGFLSGIGYLGERIGAGFMQSVEGIWDFAAGGLADVFGADEWAERQMSTDWFGDWYSTAGDWFDAKGGWKTAGDVASGIGTTLPAIVAAVGGGVATALSGGTAAPLAVKAISVSIAPLTAGLGAAGTSTKEAYQKTGELTGKEYGYGALSGTLEAGIEAVTGGLGTGSARIAKSVFKGATKTAAQEAAEAVTKKSIKDIAWKAAKRAGADFVSEGVEEGLTEMISPYLQRFTYDPSAENATPEEIAYAAVIGGLAGAVMGSTGSMIGAGVNTISDARAGAKAIEAGQEQEILALAKDISAQIANGEAGYEVLSAVDVVYKRLSASIGGGNVTTLQQKADLGKLKKLLSVTPVLPTVEASAMGLVSNPEAAIAKYSQLGITDENGNQITVEKLTEGLDFDENGRASVSSLRKAISQNRVLGTLAIAEATGRLMVDHETYLSNATASGYLGGRAQYQNFVENASPEQKAAMAQLVGAENLDAVDYETFAKRMIEYGNSTEGSAKIRSARDIRKTAENIPENEKAIPPAVSTAMKDGVHRFGGKEGIAIFKNGDTVRIYDYETRNTTRELTIEEASAELRKARRALPEIRAEKVEATDKSSAEKVESGRRYSLPDVDSDAKSVYTKEQYEHFGWALENEILTPGENAHYRKQFAAADKLGDKYRMTSSGEYMIPVSDIYDAVWEGVERKIVYAKGTIDNPIITRVLEIDLYTGTEIDNARRETYVLEGRGIQREAGGIFTVYAASDFRYGKTSKGVVPESTKNYNRLKSERRASGGKIERVNSFVRGPQNAHYPVRAEFVDISGVRRAVVEYEKGQYQVLGSRVLRKFPTVEEAIFAEDKNIINGYAGMYKKTPTEVINALREDPDFLKKARRRNKKFALPEGEGADTVTQTKPAPQNLSAEDVAAFAKENVKGYEDLLPAERREIRAMIRQGKALGVPDADIKTYATVSARSGVRVAFSKERTVYTKEDGTRGYADGFYDPVKNEIVVNPEGTRSPGKLLMHELSHALYSYKKYRAVLDKATRRMDEVRAEQVTKQYREAGESAAVISEELAVHHAEDVLGSRANLERVVEAEPNIKSKILSFFRLAKTDYAGDSRLSLNAGRLYRHFEKAFNDFAARNKGNLTAETVTRTNPENTQVSADGKRYAFVGRTEDGRGIYRSNYPANTPKAIKQRDIINLAQNVWSKKPIRLSIIVDGKTVPIEARFNPELTERSDLSKIAFGNRKGTNSEKRITLDLSSDLYQIAEESSYVRSKYETGKDNPAHLGVSEWHYFLTNLVFIEDDGTRVDCYMNIDIKKNDSGHWFYSFAIEKGTAPRTLLAGVTEESATVPTNSIPDSSEKINPHDEISSRRKALPDTTEAVGKTKKRYEPSKKEAFFTAKDRAYIETVDELYGIEKYLHKIGGTTKAAVEADVQLARAARSQAQTMIGSVQYNVFSDKPKRMGGGLLEIYKPTRLWSQEKYTAFDNYLLHQLNIDRMTLEPRSKAWTAAERAQIAKVEGDIATLNTQMKTLRADIRKAETAINNAKVRRGASKLAATKARWQAQVDALTKQKATDEADLKKAERDTKRKIAELRRLRKELKALELKNKPVFGKDETLDEQGNMKRDHDITAAESRAIVAEYEKKCPEFAEIAKKLYTYLDNLQTMRVEAGLISRESADYMKKLYPHYVPSYRDTEGRGVSIVKGKNNLEISRTVRKAKGGNQDILDVASSIATQTDELMKAGHINLLARELYDAAKASGDDTYVRIISEEAVGAEADTDAILRPKPGQLTFYRDGKKVTMEVSKEILLGFEALRSPTVDLSNPLERTMAKINSLFKRGVTSLNPAFMLRNPIRDLQDAGLNSRHPAGFAKAMAGISQKGILTDDPDWQLYRALGGFSSTVFDGTLEKQSGYAGFDSLRAAFDSDAEGIRKVWDKMTGGGKAAIRAVENANAFFEQMTRFAEFKASLAAGDSPAVALNNSAEVTTNFGRRGRLTKKLNATLMPFLNPAIQGFDKIFRNVGDAFTGGHMVRGVASLLTKAALIGALPMVLNRLMYDDDEDYEKLRETDKENYFLVKIGDGHFIKIPRGRLAAVIGGAYNRGAKAARGEDPEVLDYLDNAKSQITPVENVSRNIFSPLFDVRNNRTWYGGEIEGREFDATAPRERYDESTSRIAVAIGSIIPNSWNFSPKKIHYLLDQYSGVVGDFVLPATTEKEHKGFFSGNFTLDSVTSNKLSEKFYDLYDKTQYADTAGDEAAAYRLKYLNRVKKSIRTLNEELEAIRTGGYSNTEKLARTRTVRALINAEYDAALKSIGVLDEAIEATAAIGDEVLRDAEVTRRVFGAESALENYNKKSYERYTLFHKAGVGFDELYAYHFATLGIESDTDKKGNVIEGSKKKKILAVINALNIPREQKLMLLAAKGYAPKDGDIKGVSAASAKKILLSYIMKQKITKAEKAELARACGFTVKGGVIVNK